MVPIAAIAISARTPIQDSGRETPPELRRTEDIVPLFFPPHAHASSSPVEYQLDDTHNRSWQRSGLLLPIVEIVTTNLHTPRKVRKSCG